MKANDPGNAHGSLPADLDVLYSTYGPVAQRMATRWVGDRDLAADVVQEAFLSLWRGRHRYRPERGQIGGLLYTLVHRRAVELLRHRASWPAFEPLDHQHETTLPSNQPGPDEVASGADQTRRVLAALDRLPTSTSEPFRLAWLQDYRTIEIAALLGVPQGTVKNRILSARKQLQTLVPREAFDG
jgi:RNA polymerase sigma factor (sigma-70 family)